MTWMVVYHPEFLAELKVLDLNVADKLRELAVVLSEEGPQLGRPLVDTLNGSKFRQMKEIRIAVGGAWRFAFAFDPERQAVILVGGNKEGMAPGRFYDRLIRVADRRFEDWLSAMR